MSRLDVVQAFINSSRELREPEELDLIMGEVTREMGFDCYGLIDNVDLSSVKDDLGHMQRGEFVAMSNYPDEWLRVYIAENLVAIDPVVAAAQRAGGGFAWRELPALVELTPERVALMKRAIDYGLGDGFTVPGIVQGEVRGTCSFAVGPGRALPEAEFAMAELVGRYAYEAARSMTMRARNGQLAHVKLSPRQIECIELIALGKTDWEISRILGLSEGTVKDYVDDARRRYGVAKRVQLVLRAVFDGHILLRDLACAG